MASAHHAHSERTISSRFSSLTLRPQTSYTTHPSSTRAASSSTFHWQDPSRRGAEQNGLGNLKQSPSEIAVHTYALPYIRSSRSTDILRECQPNAHTFDNESIQRKRRKSNHNLLAFGKSIVRRASTTLVAPVKRQKDHGISSINVDRGSSQATLVGDGVTEHLVERPSTSMHVFDGQSHHRPTTSAGNIMDAMHMSSSRGLGFLRRMKSSIRPRREASEQHATLQPETPTAPFHQPLMFTNMNRSPIMPMSQPDWPRARPGAAARASAREASTAQSQNARSSTSAFSGTSENVAGSNGRSSLLVRQDTKCNLQNRDSVLPSTDSPDGERDSMIFGTDDNVGVSNETRRDPIGRDILPVELRYHILSFLDYQSLVRASAVSRTWRELASSENNALWRDVFLESFQPRDRLSENPLQMGGSGVGGSRRDPQDWYQMYRARTAIDRNWQNGTPNAIYFQGHTDSVYCAQFDENKLITGSRDRTIRVWDINTYKCLKVIAGESAKPESPNPNEPPLEAHHFTIERGRNLNGTAEGDQIFHAPEDFHTASILCLQFDHEIMVTGSSDSTCIIWDITDPAYNYRPIRRLVGHTAGVLDVCFDGRHIVSCSKDFDIKIWSRTTGALVDTFRGHNGPVNAVQMRGRFLVSASGDGFSKLWDLDRMRHLRDFHSKDRGLAAVEFSDDGKCVLAGGNDMIIYKYCVATGNLLKTYRGHTGLVRSLFLDSQNGRIISGSYDQSMRVFDFATGESVGGDTRVLPQPSQQPSSTSAPARIGAYENWTTSWILSAKSDYRRIVATSQDGRALLMDFGRGVDRAGLEMLKGKAARELVEL